MANTTWNPADIAAGMVLSGGNLTASNTGNFTGVRAVKGWNAGKYYFEFTVTAMTSGYIGLAKSTNDLTSGGTSGAVGVNSSGVMDVNGVTPGPTIGGISGGAVIGIAIDITGNLVWFRNGAAGSWNATSGAANNPATGVGGVSISAIAGTLFPWFIAVFAPSQSVTANFGDSAFSGAVPSGYTAGWPQAISNTTWSATDKIGNITLSGTNSLTATSGSGSSGIRTIDRQGAGKYYFEYVCTTWSGSASVGVANSAAALGTVAATPTNAALLYAGSGNIWVNNVFFAPSLGARANGDIIGVALDQDNKRIWFRVAPAGNWNGSGTANPATGVGGVSLASISLDAVLAPLYGVFAPVTSGTVITANFGDTAFTGTVPVGFTSGFPTGTPTLIAANTQMLVEEWGAPNPAAQATQLLLEEWAVVLPYGDMRATQVAAEQWAGIIPPQMQVTQAAIEQWTSTANVTTRMLMTQEAIEQWGTVAVTGTVAARQAAVTIVT
jgi:hypothetical protein